MHKKKKILFIMPSLEGGGAEKSLVSLIGALDEALYDIHILLFEKTGLFLSALPSYVTLLEPEEALSAFSKPLMKSIESLNKQDRRFMPARLFYSFNQKVKKGKKVRNLQNSWKLVSNLVEERSEEYDAVIGYLEMWPIYFAVEKVKAKVKIGVIHTNYTKFGMDKQFDYGYFDKLDHLLTVSEECRISLTHEFPGLANKVKVMENIIAEKGIFELAEQDDGFRDEFNGIRLLTIGRLDFNKGYDLAIDACAELIDRGFPVRWYAMGDGPDLGKLIKQVKIKGLENHFIFLGSVSNPYPYLKQTDLYIHPSRLEGKSLAVEEAKVLKKPIVVTAYDNVKDQITEGVDGIIVNINSEALTEGVIRMIESGIHLNGSITSYSETLISNEKEVLEIFDSVIGKSLLPS